MINFQISNKRAELQSKLTVAYCLLLQPEVADAND